MKKQIVKKENTQSTQIKNLNKNVKKTIPPFESNENNTNNNIEDLNNIENLESLLNQIKYLNLKFNNSFIIQKETAENAILDKINDCSKLRETNFNLYARINGINNISKIEEYFTYTYNKIITIQPKLVNFLENIDDLKENINFGLDRLYLQDNIVCDESELSKNLQKTTISLNELIEKNEEKFNEIESMKKNYLIFLQILSEEKQKFHILQTLLKNYKSNILKNSIQDINSIIKTQNKELEFNLYN